MFMKMNVFSVLATFIMIPSTYTTQYTPIFTPRIESSTTGPSITNDYPEKARCSSLVQRCVAMSQLPADDGLCYFPFSRGPCTLPGFWFILSAEESAASGQLKGVCARRPCKRHQVLHQGRCTSLSEVRVEECKNGPVYVDLEGSIRCGINPGWRALFDNALPCDIKEIESSTTGPSITNNYSDTGEWCSQLVLHCFVQNLLPYTKDGRCYKPLSRGPCKNNAFWFTLSSQESRASGQLTGHCVLRPCRPGRFGLQGRCASATEASERMCQGGPVHPDLRGLFQCGDSPGWSYYLYEHLPCSKDVVHSFSPFISGVEAAFSNEGEVVPEVNHRSTGHVPLDIDE